MKREIIAEGKDIQEAQANAAKILGVTALDNVTYETIAFPKRGFLGLGASPAKVKATLVIPEEAPKEPRRPERKKKEKPAAGAAPVVSRPKEPTPPREPMKSESEVVLTPVEAAEGEDCSFDFVNRLLSNLGIRAEAALYTQDEGGRRICITGEDAGMLIGHHGETLDAMQYLANLACTKKNINGERIRDHVTIDVEGYRAKREETLRALARRTAHRALKTGHYMTLEPMNAYERRVIHSEIQGIPGVTTNSIGSENNRRVMVIPEAAQQTAPAVEPDAPAEDEGV